MSRLLRAGPLRSTWGSTAYRSVGQEKNPRWAVMMVISASGAEKVASSRACALSISDVAWSGGTRVSDCAILAAPTALLAAWRTSGVNMIGEKLAVDGMDMVVFTRRSVQCTSGDYRQAGGEL